MVLPSSVTPTLSKPARRDGAGMVTLPAACAEDSSWPALPNTATASSAALPVASAGTATVQSCEADAPGARSPTSAGEPGPTWYPFVADRYTFAPVSGVPHPSVSRVVTGTPWPGSPAADCGDIASFAPEHGADVPGTSVVAAGLPAPATLSALIWNV